MSKSRYSETITVAAFVAGATIAAGLTLLFSPRSGREVRHSINDIKDDALDKLRGCAREARFKMAPKTRSDEFRYEGGDCWI